MTQCPKCHARNQFITDLGGDLTCLACGATPGGPLQRVKPRAQACSRGHPMVVPPCWTCITGVGRSSPRANAAQKAGMEGVVRR